MMADDQDYVLAHADESAERERLFGLGAWLDPITVRHLHATGIEVGWRCLEVGAGGGSIARWLADCVGATGSVLATDIDVRFLTDLPPTVEVRRHDLRADELERGAYDLVHCRAVLQHLPDSRAGLTRMADAVAPGGWLVVEENDLGLLTIVGAPGAERATEIIHDLTVRWRAAGILDALFGRKVPHLVEELGLEALGIDAVTAVGKRGDPVCDTLVLAWPQMRLAAAAVGLDEADLACVDEVFASPSTMMVTMTLFAAWGRRPR
jgi:SAM-dependent methyltransferase